MTREQARREIDSLDFYLQNHTDDYGEESHMAMMMAIEALSRSEKPNTCGDAISRQAVLDEIDRRFDLAKPFKQLIESMPSVIPQQRTGRWEEYYTFLDPMTPRHRCSICKEHMEKILDGNQLVEWWSDYCPHCGAKMEVEYD